MSKRGRPPKGPEADLRDWLIYKNVQRFMDESGAGTYGAALSQTAAPQGLNQAAINRAYEGVNAVITDHETPTSK